MNRHPHPLAGLSDEQIDRLTLVGMDELLEELLASRDARRLDPGPGLGSTRRHWRTLTAGAVAGVAAAAVIAVPLLIHADQAPGRPAQSSGPAPASASGSASQSTSDPASDPASDSGDPAVVGAEPWTSPSDLAILDVPGWTLDPDSVSTDPDYGLELSYVHGRERLSLLWVDAHAYQGLVADNTSGERVGQTEVLGRPASYVEYESQQQLAFVPVSEGYGLRVDGAFTTPEEFQSLLAALTPTSSEGFAAALPADVVRPADAESAERRALRGVDTPDGLELTAPSGYNGSYQVAVGVVGDVGCAWARQFVRPGSDAAARHQAEQALADSTGWPVLTDELAQPQWFSDTVSAMRRGAPDDQILGAAGCPQSQQELTSGSLAQALPGVAGTGR